MTTLQNDFLSISVNDFGAELCSIKRGGREYLWQSDPTYWNRYSPVLFPFVGKVWNGEYHVNGKAYPMGQHGFARDMMFSLVSQENNRVCYALESNEETLRKYPYPFRLEISYVLHDNKVDVCWHVINTGNSDMYFQIGAHPAFFWPCIEDTAKWQSFKGETAGLMGYFRLSRAGKCPTLLHRSVLTDKGCVDPELQQTMMLQEAGWLPLTFDVFSKDALVLESSQVDRVELMTADRKPYLALDFEAPLVGLWSPPGKHAPFVCIEPWYGRCDRVDFFDDISERDHINRLSPNAHFEVKYTITVE